MSQNDKTVKNFALVQPPHLQMRKKTWRNEVHYFSQGTQQISGRTEMHPKSSDLHSRVIALHQLFPYMCLAVLSCRGLADPLGDQQKQGVCRSKMLSGKDSILAKKSEWIQLLWGSTKCHLLYFGNFMKILGAYWVTGQPERRLPCTPIFTDWDANWWRNAKGPFNYLLSFFYKPLVLVH